MVLAVQLRLHWWLEKVKVPEAAWVAGNDPVREKTFEYENEWSLIGIPGGAISRGRVQVDDPGVKTSVNPEMVLPSAETRNSTVPPSEWVPV